MTRSTHTLRAGVLLACCVVFFGLIFVMLFFIPRLEQAWWEQGLAFSFAQQCLVNVSRFFVQHWWNMLPFLLLLTAGSITWLVLSLCTKRSPQNN